MMQEVTQEEMDRLRRDFRRDWRVNGEHGVDLSEVGMKQAMKGTMNAKQKKVDGDVQEYRRLRTAQSIVT